MLKFQCFLSPASLSFALFLNLHPAIVKRPCGDWFVSGNSQWFTTKWHCPIKAGKRRFLHQQRESSSLLWIYVHALQYPMVNLLNMWTGCGCRSMLLKVSCWPCFPKKTLTLCNPLIPLGKKKCFPNFLSFGILFPQGNIVP